MRTPAGNQQCENEQPLVEVTVLQCRSMSANTALHRHKLTADKLGPLLHRQGHSSLGPQHTPCYKAQQLKAMAHCALNSM